MKAEPRYTRRVIADAMLIRIDRAAEEQARKEFRSARNIGWFAIDDLLPQEMAYAVRNAFPSSAQMRERKTLREHKFVAAQMDRYDAQAEEALFAFHDERVVALVAEITGLTQLHADPHLYAGGISLMEHGNFLNPHLDNSHNNDRSLYRVLNLLYYVSPDWSLADGGNLELWPDGVKMPPLTIPSTFNRLVVMTTGPQSWHSVSRVCCDRPRCCVSNYYFSPVPIGNLPYFRVTAFRGRPEEPVRDLVLRADAALRGVLRAFKPQGLVQTTHIYQKPIERD